jgi:hypothetical protein
MKKLIFSAIATCALSSSLMAQEDLLNMMNSEPSKPEPVMATFKTTRILNGQSIEQVATKHLDFRINHRFNKISDGFENFWGLDGARIRLSLEYGINDWAMVGIGRNNAGLKAWDYFGKFRILRQKKDNSMPLSLSFLGTAAVNIVKTDKSTSLTDRTTYTWQLLLARKFSDGISLQLSPGIIHRNQRETREQANDLFNLGMGGRFKISKRVSFNLEYFLRANAKKYSTQDLYNTFSFGFDIETGGHVFQLHVTNSSGLIEKDFMSGTSNRWSKGDILYGFNVSRVFSFK